MKKSFKEIITNIFGIRSPTFAQGWQKIRIKRECSIEIKNFLGINDFISLNIFYLEARNYSKNTDFGLIIEEILFEALLSEDIDLHGIYCSGGMTQEMRSEEFIFEESLRGYPFFSFKKISIMLDKHDQYKDCVNNILTEWYEGPDSIDIESIRKILWCHDCLSFLEKKEKKEIFELYASRYLKNLLDLVTKSLGKNSRDNISPVKNYLYALRCNIDGALTVFKEILSKMKEDEKEILKKNFKILR